MNDLFGSQQYRRSLSDNTCKALIEKNENMQDIYDKILEQTNLDSDAFKRRKATTTLIGFKKQSKLKQTTEESQSIMQDDFDEE